MQSNTRCSQGACICSVHNNRILHLILSSVVCQMDLIRNFLLHSYLCCFFESTLFKGTMSLFYEYHFVCNDQCTADKTRQISINEMLGVFPSLLKNLFSSAWFFISLCWQLLWVYIFCPQQWFLLSPRRWSWGLSMWKVRVCLYFCW